MKKTYTSIFVIGFALFSMFFGAGNLIFPPFLGLETGLQWLLGFICYYLADIGLALMALFAMLESGGSDGITRRIGHIPATVLMSAIVLCIGPMVAIPRTAATTFEMSIKPLWSSVSPVLFSIVFFLIILALCIRENAVVDIVGKFLTPALLLGLIILIVKGVISPLGSIAPSQVASVPATGIKAGYQTMDVLGAMVFGIIILKSAEDKGHTEKREKNRVVIGAGIVSGVALFLVYLGLTYLGATVSNQYGTDVSRSVLVVSIVRSLLGQAGLVIFGIVVALACITTAVALVSSAATYFSQLSRGKISYSLLVIVICVFSAFVSNIGLDTIVAIASPILDIVYPPALVLIVLSFFGRKIRNDNVFRMATLGALLTSILFTIRSYSGSMVFLDHLPLATLGFGWIIPAIVFGLLGWLIKSKKAAV
ncbi:MAG: branched-chain amino acid transport system II carrier protein [Clostridiales bacterium]|nr:branched-chain amino acid transport system II carrier protein [Clostridiales bacterium]